MLLLALEWMWECELWLYHWTGGCGWWISVWESEQGMRVWYWWMIVNINFHSLSHLSRFICQCHVDDKEFQSNWSHLWEYISLLRNTQLNHDSCNNLESCVTDISQTSVAAIFWYLTLWWVVMIWTHFYSNSLDTRSQDHHIWWSAPWLVNTQSRYWMLGSDWLRE